MKMASSKFSMFEKILLLINAKGVILTFPFQIQSNKIIHVFVHVCKTHFVHSGNKGIF